MSTKIQPLSATEAHMVQSAQTTKSLYIYELPVRLWHWVNAFAIVVLCATGYLITSPLPSPAGEAAHHFMMGYIRFAHFAAGYIMAIGLVGRAYWALVGNYHAKELFVLPVMRMAFWREVLHMMKWYLFLIPQPHRYVGHNPMARVFMFTGYLLIAIFMIITGFALYGEGAQAHSWSHTLFTSWVLPLFGGNSQTVHTWHHLGMWGMVIFVMSHIYSAIREDIMGRQSMVSTMISGFRTFKD